MWFSFKAWSTWHSFWTLTKVFQLKSEIPRLSVLKENQQDYWKWFQTAKIVMHTTHGCSVCVENSYIVVENSKSIFWSYAVLVKGKAIDKLQSPACGYFLFLDLVSCWENFYAMGFSHHSVKPAFSSKLFYYHWIFNSCTQLLCGGGLTFIRVDILGR